MDVVVTLIIVAVSLLIYFVPYIMARENKKQNAGAIGALNFFLGWTLVGWVVALVWAISKDAPVAQVQVAPTIPPKPLAPAAPQKTSPDCAEIVLSEAGQSRFA